MGSCNEDAILLIFLFFMAILVAGGTAGGTTGLKSLSTILVLCLFFLKALN